MVEADSTRGRILDAATEEFAAHGLAGARVDAISRRAGANKQLIYHYFGNKVGLYEAVTMRVLAERTPMMVSSPEELGQGLDHLFGDATRRRLWWRLMLWESLETGDGPLVAEETRRAEMAKNVEEIAHAQRAGMVDPALPPRLLLLALTGMLMLPFLMPQLVRLWVGTTADDPAFQREYRAMVLDLLSRLGPRA